MQLHTVWFLIDLVFWAGFFVLEGFDFGVGMLHGVVGRTDLERRQAINAIGPFWDGNEVWLIVAGAVIFAAFPAWYATMFSSLYLALVVVLIALIMRGVSFEFRGKIPGFVSLLLTYIMICVLIGVCAAARKLDLRGLFPDSR